MQPEVPSPCISICVLDDAGNCTGCLRTVDEIAAWSTMPRKEKLVVLDRIDAVWDSNPTAASGQSPT